MDFKNLKLQSRDNKVLNSLMFAYIPVIVFALNIVLIILFPLDNSSIYFSFEYSLVLIIILILLNKIVYVLLCITSQNPNRIQATKEIITKIINYDFPIILSLIAIFIQVSLINTEQNMVSFSEIITFQQSYINPFFNGTMPSLMIFLNPFSFLAYISALVGIYREKNLGVMDKTDILDKWIVDEEFGGNKRSLLEFSKAIQSFILISLMFPVFFGYYWSNENIFINIGWMLLLDIIAVIIIASIGGSRPRTKIDRTVLNWIRTPHVFAFLAILYSIFFGLFFNT